MIGEPALISGVAREPLTDIQRQTEIQIIVLRLILEKMKGARV